MFGWLRKRPAAPVPETRSSGAGYTAAIMAARESFISGSAGLAELTATVQTAVSLWENGLALADVQGTDLMTRRDMALAARALALRGEAVFLIRDRLIPCSDWDVLTRDTEPVSYRLSVAETGGGYRVVALAGEVLHFRLAPDPVAPWTGVAPLRRARLTAGLLQEVETALAEVWREAPLGSAIIPFPESQATDLEVLGRGFRGRRGRVLLRESVSVTAAGGPQPAQDWRPAGTTPDLGGVAPVETLAAARGAILGVFGVLPGLLTDQAQGPVVREAQRHLAQWFLQPLAMLMAEELTRKLDVPIFVDAMRPLQAYDSGNRARSFAGIIEGLARAKEAGLTPEQVNAALTFVNLGGNDGAA